MAKWFIEKSGQEIGPLSTGQLRQKAAAGELAPTDKVRKEDMPQWARAGTVKGLFDVIIPPLVHPPAEPPPPIPEGNASPFDFFGHGAESGDPSVLESRSEFDFYGDQTTGVQPRPPEAPDPTAPLQPKKIEFTPSPSRPKKPRGDDDMVPIAQPAPISDFGPPLDLTPMPGALRAVTGQAVEVTKNVAHLTGGTTLLSLAEHWVLARTHDRGSLTELYLPLARLDAVSLSDAALPGGPWKVLTLTAGRTTVAVAFAGDSTPARSFAEQALARVGLRKLN